MRDLADLNGASQDEARGAFLQCCGSFKWARQMADERPFQDMNELLLTADHAWWSLDEEDWIEAFSAHPKIGDKKATQDASESSRWAVEEQSGASLASQTVQTALMQANHDYEKRFGYIFIVCATGKSAEEMLGLLRVRLKNEQDTELRIAAEEQRRITHIRLNKLLG